ncbi:PilZ domain-containing protein [Sphingorhabdus sp.]|jgi:hypothetical protein|uniref:PilZ domain-containing protein n=1 Tax=Sphingorhabdus sp. TaxID=1902408 RepID=UPI0040542B44
MNSASLRTISYKRYEGAAREDRSAPRVCVKIPAIVRPSGSSGYSVIVRNLSLSGIACEALTRMPAGTQLRLTLPGLMAIQAKVIWNDCNIVGCEFSTMLNPAALQNILTRFPA